MAFTKLYLANRAAGYTPATIRGAWDDTAGAVTKALDPNITGDGGALTTVARAETNVSTTYDVLLYRGVSHGLSAQTISGTVDVLIGILESTAAADFYWHIHIYVTQGDSDTPRGTLLTDWVENTTNEFPVTAAGTALQSAQTLSSLAISAGDRLVVEIGYIARNSSGSSRTGTLNYGTTSTGLPVPELTLGGDPTIGAGYVVFSNSITDSVPTINVSREVVRTLADISTPDARMSRMVVRTLSTNGTATGTVSRLVVRTLSASVVVSTESASSDVIG